MKNKVYGIIAVLIIAGIPLALIASGAYLVYKTHGKEKRSIIEEIANIEPFSLQEAEKDVADEMGLTIPVNPPSRSIKDIKKEISSKATEVSKEKFNPKVIAEKKMELVKKYDNAKVGDKVEFMLSITGKKISGNYYGFDGVFVKVESDKFRINDIDEDYRYLFDKVLSGKITNAKMNEFSKNFNDSREAFRQETVLKLENELCPQAGYLKVQTGEWVSIKDVFLGKVEKMKKKYDDDRVKKIQDIFMRHRLFGIMRINVDIPSGGGEDRNTQ